MLKYLYNQVVFSEIPQQITLGISISGCQIHCKGCHSRDLWEDKGTELTYSEVEKLITSNEGITCVLLLGGERDIAQLTVIFMQIKLHFPKLKTAWYCGLDMLPIEKYYIIRSLDYIKMGHYDAELGGLASPTTNQRLYHIIHSNKEDKAEDITYQLQKKVQNDN